jgi:hypothetical protein
MHMQMHKLHMPLTDYGTQSSMGTARSTTAGSPDANRTIDKLRPSEPRAARVVGQQRMQLNGVQLVGRPP